MVISQKPGLHRYDLISRRCLTQQKIRGELGRSGNGWTRSLEMPALPFVPQRAEFSLTGLCVPAAAFGPD